MVTADSRRRLVEHTDQVRRAGPASDIYPADK